MDYKPWIRLYYVCALYDRVYGTLDISCYFVYPRCCIPCTAWLLLLSINLLITLTPVAGPHARGVGGLLTVYALGAGQHCLLTMQGLYTAVKKLSIEHLLGKRWLAHNTFVSGANTKWKLWRV